MLKMLIINNEKTKITSYQHKLISQLLVILFMLKKIVNRNVLEGPIYYENTSRATCIKLVTK